MDIKDLKGLMEAYNTVHAPQELTEEQVWEEVENWVNSLLEEGYALSDYTWEEMYEAYIEELTNPINDLWNNRGRIAGAANRAYSGTMRGANAAVNQLGTSATNTAKAVKGAVTSPRVAAAASGFNAGGLVPAISGALSTKSSPQKSQSDKPPAARPAAAAPAARTPAARTPAARPAAAAPAARPAAAPAAKPTAAAVAKPAAKPTPAPSTPAAKPSGMDQWAKANPRLAQAQQIRKQGGSRAEVNKALYNKGTAAATSTPTVVKAGFDLFDIVKGHLLDEGYADTEDAALVIMANMSEEWKKNIVEAVKGASRHDTEMRRAASKERRGGDKRLSPSKGKANADKMERDVKHMDRVTKKNKNIIVGMTHEELNIFDVVLEFLQAEGYAETLEEAEWMMANVIDEEAISIVIGEAKAARENPEGHDKEEKKKYAPVRGEKTPMPPRGNKRREDFEKWYAANVR